MDFNNKKGAAMIEGALILPLIILIIVSLIMVTVHFYRSAEKQFDIHTKVGEEYGDSASTLRIETVSIEHSSLIKGLFLGKLTEKEKNKCHILNEIQLMRIGNLANNE
ncbi:hypothetical protein SAMN02910327_01505 [Peptostreptococcaceae bacterium pGA-8]|nr:hypothetical protein SAMN02910327_01505 [Peptostreptococcaceae bacterium pGA-8]